MNLSKFLKKLIVVILVVILLFNFTFAKKVEAESFLAKAGGTLIEPICDLLVMIADVVLETLQTNFLTDQTILLEAKSSEESSFSWGAALAIVGGVVAIVGGVALCCTGVGAIAGAGSISAGLTAFFTTSAGASIAGGVLLAGTGATVGYALGVKEMAEALSGEYDLPMISYTPYAIFTNTIPILDINFFSPMQTVTETVTNDDGTTETIEYESSGSILQTTVATWYVTLRTIAIIGLLIILLYIGIRIMISSTSQDKAKYKQRLMDWIIAFCLLFMMHYIMVFIVNMVERLDTLIGDGSGDIVIAYLPADTEINGYDEELEVDDETGYIKWACTFTGYARLIARRILGL